MAMQFVKADAVDAVVEAVTDMIQTALAAEQRVIWLVSGGSLITAEVAIMQNLAASDCSGLAIFQADERYGEIGHTDSNWQRLLDAGFDASSAYAMPMLVGLSLEETVQRYDGLLRVAFTAENVVCIGLFGIGADGHTAGILPGSIAAQPTTAFALGYEAADFSRITITPTAIARTDIAVAYATGQSKSATLKQLFETTTSPIEQPAQFLKTAKRAIIYNDSQEGAL